MKMKSKHTWLKAGAVTMAFAVGTGVLLPSVLNSGNISAVYAQEANVYSQVPSDVNVIDTTTHSVKDTVSAVKEKIVRGTALLL